MNHAEVHDRLIALAAQVQILRAQLVEQRAMHLAYADMFTAAIEELDAQAIGTHEAMRDLDDDWWTR